MWRRVAQAPGVPDDVTVDTMWAQRLAGSALSDLPDRWRHIQAVAAKAAEVSAVVPERDRPLLITAAWLHDIGYGPQVRATGFHPLDGARYLEAHGVSRRLCCLVAHHSGARFEAEERGFAADLGAYELEQGPVADALIYADMHCGPQGQLLTFEQRISEILTRYSPDDPVHRAISRARSVLAQAVARVERRLPER